MNGPYSLALCLDAPMQSWGLLARGTIRESGREPSKSGVVGLLGAALGIARNDDEQIATLAQLRMGVRVDREGILERDFHTANGVPKAGGSGVETVVSERYYLADAVFLVVLESTDLRLLEKVEHAIHQPVFPIFFLGRRAFPPARPLLGDRQLDTTTHTGWGLREVPMRTVLDEHPWLENQASERRTALRNGQTIPLRTVEDCSPGDRGAELRHDVPISFTHRARRFRSRTVRTGHVPLTAA